MTALLQYGSIVVVLAGLGVLALWLQDRAKRKRQDGDQS